MSQPTAFVYILRCAGGSYYVGSHRGDDVATRVAEHQNGKYRAAYTFSRRPVKLVWTEWFSRFDDAAVFERKVKGWSRAKKEALIKGDFDQLKWMAKRPGARERRRSAS